MTIIITLTTAGSNTGPFSLYSNLDGFVTPFESGVSKSALLSGYSSGLVPDFTSIIRVKSTGDCTNYIDLALEAPPATTTSSTTTALPNYWYKLYSCATSMTYFVGPFTGAQEYSLGQRVEGASATYYIITGTIDIDPETTINGITAVGPGVVYGCPLPG